MCKQPLPDQQVYRIHAVLGRNSLSSGRRRVGKPSALTMTSDRKISGKCSGDFRPTRGALFFHCFDVFGDRAAYATQILVYLFAQFVVGPFLEELIKNESEKGQVGRLRPVSLTIRRARFSETFKPAQMAGLTIISCIMNCSTRPNG